MITIFRRIRQRLIDSGSTSKYLLYAMGEILLVVIGILIALQVNNWNEKIRNEKLINSYIIQIQNELVNDLAENAAVTRDLEGRDDLFEKVLKEQVTNEDYLKNPSLRDLIRSRPSFNLNRTGYVSFMNVVDEQSFDYPGEARKLKFLYEDTFEEMKLIQDAFDKSILDYISRLNKEFDWYYKSDALIGEFDEAELDYLLNDPFYKNDVFTYREFAMRNYKTLLYNMQIQKAELVRSLGDITGYNPGDELTDAFFNSLPDSVYASFLGTYRNKDSGIPEFTYFTENDSLKVRLGNGSVSYLVRGSNNGFQLKGSIIQLIIENDSTLRAPVMHRPRFIKVEQE